MATRFTFGKKEKLKSRKRIDDLFRSGKSISMFPIRTSYQLEASSGPGLVQAGVTVSKRNFRHAADRNRIKRLLREAYRLQKAGLLQAAAQKEQNVFVFLMYTNKTILPFEAIQEAVRKTLKKLENALDEKHEKTS